MNSHVSKDHELASFIAKEKQRQEEHLELIASENYVSKDILSVQGSILTNKYAEGYPGKRYYGGCKWVDEIERLAIKRACELFECNFANVQPHSGSQANMAAYRAVLDKGDTVLSLKLSDGGHLTHGHHMSFSGQDYNFIPYELNAITEEIDYVKLREKALEYKPRAIVAGASAYSRIIDFALIKSICDEVGCYLIVDMAHIAGLVAARLHPNPCLYADVVTSTTHKTLRGPRGGIILSNKEDIAKKIDQMVFPGIQGGPLMHVIAGKAVAFKEALEPGFTTYMKQVIANTQAMAEAFKDLGYHVVSGGSDNHMFLIDVFRKTALTGLKAEQLLDLANITVNKNTIPNDTQKPFITSGIRIGTPALTTRGMIEDDMRKIASWIDNLLTNPSEETINIVSDKVKALCLLYPLWY